MKNIYEQVDDTLQASSMMSDDELLYEVAHTVWNILS